MNDNTTQLRSDRGIKKLLPSSLFGRALLILVVPTVLVQLVSAYAFFERHWDNVTRHMSNSLAGEIALLVHEIERAPEESRRRTFIEQSGALMGVNINIEESRHAVMHKDTGKKDFPEFYRQLDARINDPFTVETTADDSNILIRVHGKNEVINLSVSIKRLASGTTRIFMLWVTGSALVLLIIATIFLRNQIRPIRALAEAAESFGKGQEIPSFRPSGATEVRRAARAFLVMRERIRRQIRTRVEMLAGISHDLRTPLTRMKLQLAMLEQTAEVRELSGDVAEMEHMIEEYLDFVRGEGGEEPISLPLSTLLQRVVENARRQGHDVTLQLKNDAELILRANAITRALTNLVDNAVRYGTRCTIHADTNAQHAFILIEDEGPGIPAEERTTVFRPFTRLDPARNPNRAGVGLGLTIARDMVQSHGGDITLEDVHPDAPTQKGLRVKVRLPI